MLLPEICLSCLFWKRGTDRSMFCMQTWVPQALQRHCSAARAEPAESAVAVEWCRILNPTALRLMRQLLPQDSSLVFRLPDFAVRRIDRLTRSAQLYCGTAGHLHPKGIDRTSYSPVL